MKKNIHLIGIYDYKKENGKANGMGLKFKSENFSKKSFIDQLYQNCSFLNCDFTEADWRNAKFSSCDFQDCNISLVKMEGCRLQEIRFTDCKIVGAEFFKCDKLFFSTSFKKSVLHYCNFSDLNMNNTTFLEGKLKECYFTNTLLKGAKFEDVDLSNTLFHNCDLTKADFSSATHYMIDPQANKLKNAKFSMPEVINLLHSFGIIITS